MRAYRIEGSLGDSRIVKYAGSQSDASTARVEICDQLSIKKKDVSIEEISVPTDKDGLLKFLNGL